MCGTLDYEKGDLSNSVLEKVSKIKGLNLDAVLNRIW